MILTIESPLTSLVGSKGSYFLLLNFSNSSLNSSNILTTRALNALPLTPPISTFSSLSNSNAVLNKSFQVKLI